MLSRLLCFYILMSLSWSCSHWDAGRILPRRGVSSESQQTTFTVYHNLKPSRRSGGSVEEIRFQTPKHLTELSLEFVNYKVSVKKIELVSASGKVNPVTGFRGQFLEAHQRHVTLRNLPKHDDIVSVRISAEGFTHDDVMFTVSFFSPQGFLASEQGKLRAGPPSLAVNQASLQIPVCLQTEQSLRGVLFDIEKINRLEVAEKRYFCQHFLNEFKVFLETFPEVARFLRVGENLEKPLVVLGRSFSYDRFKNEVSFPLLLRRRDFTHLISEFRSSTQSDPSAINRRVSQQSSHAEQLAQEMSYDDFMEMGMDSVSYLEYQDQWSFENGESSQTKCISMMNKMGISKSAASRHCRDVTGFEQAHIACMQELNELHIMLSNIHHYCLEARGKLAFYRPCMGKMIEMNFNHYDSNLFCQRTPKDYMGQQLQCLDVMVGQGYSQHQSVQTCQARWGRENTLMVCLDEQKNRLTERHERLRFCAAR